MKKKQCEYFYATFEGSFLNFSWVSLTCGRFFQILWASQNILTSPARPCPASSCAAGPHPVSPRPSGPTPPHPGDAQLGRARPREAQKIKKKNP